MRVLVGPVPPECATVWTEWTLEALDELRAAPVPAGPLSAEALDAVGGYVRAWAQATPGQGDDFRWQSEIDPDELAYVANAFYNLDGHLSVQVRRGQRRAAPVQAGVFQRVLVQALLHALAEESPFRAAFSEQLAQSWPSLSRSA
jgi:hypothetical protein